MRSPLRTAHCIPLRSVLVLIQALQDFRGPQLATVWERVAGKGGTHLETSIKTNVNIYKIVCKPTKR